MKIAKIIAAIFAIVVAAFALWFVYRANTLGIANVFSRVYVYLDARPLTEEVALELTKRALEADGRDNPSLLVPIPYPGTERLFVRNTLNASQGTVTWGPAPGTPTESRGLLRYFNVNIEKNGDEIRCRVYRHK